jgi:hypothetical protein
MAKCPVCGIRKGKRKCLIAQAQFVCSLCCANTRQEELCSSCAFYHPPQHDYSALPVFSQAVMANNHALQDYSQKLDMVMAVEDNADKLAILELLLNRYHFDETELKFDNPRCIEGFNNAMALINNELDMDDETLVGLLNTMRLAAADAV